MTLSRTETGLIAFFDVLGYRSLLLNNDIQRCSSIIQAILLRVPERVRAAMILRANNFDPAWADAMERSLGKPILFSDSIVWACAVKTALQGGVEIQWLYFLLICCFFQRAMFEKGMPVRGAISFGEYFIVENCFAGRPIVEAHDLCEKLDLVSCAITPEAEKVRPKKRVGGIDAFGGTLVEYPTPVKGTDKPQVLALLNWAFTGGTFLEPFGNDIRFRIVEAFTKHNKPIQGSVHAKVANTEAFLHYCKLVCERWNQENPGPA